MERVNTIWSLATLEEDGRAVACLEVGGKCYRLGPTLARVGLAGIETVADLFSDWQGASAAIDKAVDCLASEDELVGERRLAPLMYPGKVICTGGNYFDHLEEMGVEGATKESQRLFFFLKPPRSTIVGEGSTVHMPIASNALDWEVELAAVIGRRARNVSVEEALDYVAAYTVAIDFSARDHLNAPETFYKYDWTAGKANDTNCPIGPRLIPASGLAGPQSVGLKLWVNGDLKQDGHSSNMIFSVAEQVALASRIMTLDPGDMLLTGTPAGVGLPKRTFLSIGDKVDAEIECIGRLSVVVQPELL